MIFPGLFGLRGGGYKIFGIKGGGKYVRTPKILRGGGNLGDFFQSILTKS